MNRYRLLGKAGVTQNIFKIGFNIISLKVMTELYDLVELSYNVFSYYITWVHAV